MTGQNVIPPLSLAQAFESQTARELTRGPFAICLFKRISAIKDRSDPPRESESPALTQAAQPPPDSQEG